MGNLKEWILELANGEMIEGVVIGGMGWEDYGSEAVPQYALQVHGKVLPWDAAGPMLDYDFDAGYGAPGCNAVTVWTRSWVMAVSQYDGSTHLFRLPRHPVDHTPIMPGG